jgi:lysine biosynthesis protein LysW
MRKERTMDNVKTAQKAVAACPECGNRIVLKGQANLGHKVVCLHCYAELKVIATLPLKLGLAYRG